MITETEEFSTAISSSVDRMPKGSTIQATGLYKFSFQKNQPKQ